MVIKKDASDASLSELKALAAQIEPAELKALLLGYLAGRNAKSPKQPQTLKPDDSLWDFHPDPKAVLGEKLMFAAAFVKPAASAAGTSPTADQVGDVIMAAVIAVFKVLEKGTMTKPSDRWSGDPGVWVDAGRSICNRVASRYPKYKPDLSTLPDYYDEPILTFMANVRDAVLAAY